MRPYNQGESLYNLIKTAIPDFVETDYPLFVQFVDSFLKFLEQKRTFTPKQVFPEYGLVPDGTVDATATLGGPLYEARKLLEYRDVDQTLDEFRAHFLAMFGKEFPQYHHVPLDLFVRSLRQFYQAKGTLDSVKWFFRVLFNEDAEVYFPREDILRASDGTWSAPLTLKVSSPLFGRANDDVARFYIGQRVQTATGSAQVEAVTTSIVGQAYNQNIVVNELTLKFDSILGQFQPGQDLFNVDSEDVVHTIILPVITDVIVQSGGNNYQPGDIVTFSEGPAGGGGFGALGVVSKISNTAINGVLVLSGGDGYITGLPLTFVSTSGSGAEAVVQEISYGQFLLEDDSGYIALEQQSPDSTNRFELEDVNVLFLELIIDPFVNAIANIVVTDPDYGVAAGVAQLDGVTFDSELSIALAAVDEKPFTHPWVFTDALETTATLANAACDLSLTCNTFFANTDVVFSLNSLQDATTNLSSALVSANVIVSQVAQGGAEDTLYLKDFTNLNKFENGMVLKADGTGVLQTGTINSDGSANLVGNGTSFTTTVKPNTHLRIGAGHQVVVKQVVNNTFLVAYAATGVVLSANTFGIIPVGTVTSITPQQQRYYGKIKSIRLLQNGANYQTPPAVTCDSVSGRAQQLFYLDPGPDQTIGTGDDVITAAADQIHVFDEASLKVQQDSGQVQKVKIVNSGANYIDPSHVEIVAIHAAPRTGSDATFEAVTGALTQYPGQFTTSRSFLSSDKFLQDADFYNEYNYVVRVDESFDRYREILLKLIHPAGFRALGELLSINEVPVTAGNGVLSIRRPSLLPLNEVINPYINTEVQDFPADFGTEI